MAFLNTEQLFYTIFRTAILSIIALFFTLIALVGLGALVEDNHTTSVIFAHFAAKSLITIFAFFAAKIPLLALLKWTTISSWFSALFWRETIKPESIKPLFTFSTDTAYFNNKLTLAEIVRPIINLYRTSIENRIKFFANPLTLTIAVIKTIENFCIFIVNYLPPRTERGTPSFSIYRALKGIIILVCELPAIFLALIEPIANLPYYLLYFIVITIPDWVMWLFFEFKTEEAAAPVAAPSSSPTIVLNTTRYISQKLQHSNEEEKKF